MDPGFASKDSLSIFQLIPYRAANNMYTKEMYCQCQLVPIFHYKSINYTKQRPIPFEGFATPIPMLSLIYLSVTSKLSVIVHNIEALIKVNKE